MDSQVIHNSLYIILYIFILIIVESLYLDLPHNVSISNYLSILLYIICPSVHSIVLEPQYNINNSLLIINRHAFRKEGCG